MSKEIEGNPSLNLTREIVLSLKGKALRSVMAHAFRQKCWSELSDDGCSWQTSTGHWREVPKYELSCDAVAEIEAATKIYSSVAWEIYGQVLRELTIDTAQLGTCVRGDTHFGDKVLYWDMAIATLATAPADLRCRALLITKFQL